MKAIVQDRYGGPEVLRLEEIDKPLLDDDGVLIRVTAASVNPYDWHMMTGKPYLTRLMAGLRKPKSRVPGADVAGTVEAVGRNVTEFRPGDEVWGTCAGAYAEYARGVSKRLVLKPANVTFEQAAAVPIAGVTALQCLRDKAHVAAGQRVLINGASGGVGTFAVQIARSLGAHVTAVCSTRNTAMAQSIGADEVIDYTQNDYTDGDRGYDAIIDAVGNHSMSANRRILTPTGTYVSAGSGKKGNWVEPLISAFKPTLASLGKPQKMLTMLSTMNKDDLTALQKLLEAGEITPVIDRHYELKDAAEALRHQGEGHAQGKTIITT